MQILDKLYLAEYPNPCWRRIVLTTAVYPKENAFPLPRTWTFCPYVQGQTIFTLRIASSPSETVDKVVELGCLIGILCRRSHESNLWAITVHHIKERRLLVKWVRTVTRDWISHWCSNTFHKDSSYSQMLTHCKFEPKSMFAALQISSHLVVVWHKEYPDIRKRACDFAQHDQ